MVFLLPVTNVFAEDEEKYTFGKEDVDKIITWGEAYEPSKTAIQQCEELLTLKDEIIKNTTENLQSCETDSKKKDDIINVQTEMTTNVNDKINNAVEKAVNEEKKGIFWGKVQWGAIGTTIGIIIGVILGLL